MRQIKLTDGLPTNIRKEDLSTNTLILVNKIINSSIESGLSYVEINKALHLVDEELYLRALNKLN